MRLLSFSVPARVRSLIFRPNVRPLGRLLSWSLLGVVVGFTGACASSDAVDRAPGLDAEYKLYLEAPRAAAAGTSFAALSVAFESLLDRGSPAEVKRTAEAAMAGSGEAAGRLLLAQAIWVDGDAAGALAVLGPMEENEEFGSRLLRARLIELGGDPVDAFDLFRDLSDRSGVAAERAAALRTVAVQTVATSLAEALEVGRIDEARVEMARLDSWAPDDPLTLESRWRLVSATGDLTGELEVLRVLELLPGRRLEIAERRAILEVEIGDAQEGLRLLEALVAADPSDVGRSESLARARFRYRLRLLPEEVLGVARQAELVRADFAVLLYWLVPGVRQASTENARIATDIFDLERGRRTEVTRVVNRDLMQVDPVTHRFYPDRTLSSSEASESLLRLLTKLDAAPACVREFGLNARPSAEAICRAAVDCDLVGRDSACLPTAPVSGGEALERIRRTLAVMPGGER